MIFVLQFVHLLISSIRDHTAEADEVFVQGL